MVRVNGSSFLYFRYCAFNYRHYISNNYFAGPNYDYMYTRPNVNNDLNGINYDHFGTALDNSLTYNPRRRNYLLELNIDNNESTFAQFGPNYDPTSSNYDHIGTNYELIRQHFDHPRNNFE